MKALHKAFYTLTLSICILHSAHAQYNAANGVIDNAAQPAVSTAKAATNNGIDTATTICNSPNTFWGADAPSGLVKEFTLTGNVITYTGNYIPAAPGYSLAISNNLNGGAVSPTFYSSSVNNAFYWNGGANWVPVANSTYFLTNAGGYANNLYYFQNATPIEIVRYDGTSYTLFYSSNNIPGIADVAVDSAGNSYFITKAGTSAMSDFLYIISPTGQVVQQYPFVVNTNNAYGSFLMNGVFYIGLGISNPQYPNSILPVTFTGGSAVAGTPLSLPAGIILNNDLASCNPGYPLGISNTPAIQNFSVTPNPASSYITISAPFNKNSTYTIYTAQGKIITAPSGISVGAATVNIEHLPKGIYIVEIKSGSTVLKKKLAKM